MRVSLNELHIHPYARLVAVADVFGSLISRRSYKEPWDIDRVCAYLLELAGKQFDRQFVALLLENLPQVKALYPSEENA